MNPPERRAKTKTPRTGRRAGSSGSREAILAAARSQFAERGYAGATMRGIAAEAGVDASLVVHFFGNKVTLLSEAVEWPFDPDQVMPRLLEDGRAQVGRKLVRLVVNTWEEAGSRHPILTLLRAATTEKQAAEMLADFLGNRLFAPLMAALKSDRPELRADLALSQLVGIAMARHILFLEPLASTPADQVVEIFGPTLQRYLTGKID